MKILFLPALLLSLIGYSQTPERSLDLCAKKFQEGLAEIPQEKMGMEMQNRMMALRQCMIGQKFPSFQAASLKNKNLSSSDLEGKVTMINFWFIACPPCVAELPMLNEIHDAYKGKDFKLISFAPDDAAAINNFISKHKIKYEIFPKTNDLITKTFKMNFGYPTTFFLDRKGEIVEMKTGGAIDEKGLKWTKEEFKRIIDKELAIK